MKRLFDIVLCLTSLWFMFFLGSNWNTGGYGWAYFGYHWLISFCLALVWIVRFFRNRASRGILTYLGITLMVASIVLDWIWLNKAFSGA